MDIICWLDKNANWLTAVGTTGATLFALLAFFISAIKQWWNKPKIALILNFSPPDCQIQPMRIPPFNEQNRTINTIYSIFYRIRIRNAGKQPLKGTQICITRVELLQSDGEVKTLTEFLPIYLKWSHTESTTMKNIPPGMERLCDIGKIIDPRYRTLILNEYSRYNASETCFSFETTPKPNNLSHIIPKGTYIVHLVIGASNCKSKRSVLQISIDGNWVENQGEMLQLHSKLELLD